MKDPSLLTRSDVKGPQRALATKSAQDQKILINNSRRVQS